MTLAPAARAAGGDLNRQIDSYRLAHETQIVDQLDQLVRFRTVAADSGGLVQGATQLLTWLKQRGFDAQLLTADPGMPPLVFGALKVPGATRTVVFYAHYDGQPVVPSQWRTDPFTPVMRAGLADSDSTAIDWRKAPSPYDPEWRLYGRAAADDKASIIAFLVAFDALKASGRSPSVNIKVVWEGEEEASSVHLQQLLRNNSALFSSDLWLIGDGPVHQSRRQMIYFGARGATDLNMTVYGPVKALHDGHYGNWVPNPAAMAAALVSQMRDPAGRILIPGIADDVRLPTAAELQAIRQLPPIDDQLKTEFGIDATEGTEGLALSIMRPALNIRGLRSGQVGEASSNAIPVDADVSIDFRLVPDQTPGHVRAAVEHFLLSKGWTIVTAEPDLATRLSHPHIIRLQWVEGYAAYRSNMSTPVARAVIDTASRAAGVPVAVLPMLGGSVPLSLIANVLNAPIIGLPIVNHDDNQHAANENLRLQNLWDGIRTYAAMMNELSW